MKIKFYCSFLQAELVTQWNNKRYRLLGDNFTCAIVQLNYQKQSKLFISFAMVTGCVFVAFAHRDTCTVTVSIDQHLIKIKKFFLWIFCIKLLWIIRRLTAVSLSLASNWTGKCICIELFVQFVNQIIKTCFLHSAYDQF